MFQFSIYKDKYSIDRLNIWKMSFNVFLDNPFFGIGPNNFKNIVKRYNFKQTKGPANYSKVPKQTHNDYVKLIAENGVFGFMIIFVLLYGLIRRIKVNKILELPILLLLFLMFQALFFNILLRPFFLFIFILLLKIVFEKKIKFVNITKNFKLIFSFTVLFVFLAGHLLPFISNLYLERSIKKELTFSEKDNLLKKAFYFMPMSYQPLINRSLLHFNVFTKTFNYDFCFSALDLIKRAKRMAPDNTSIYNYEIQFYQYYYKPVINIRKNLENINSLDSVLEELLILITEMEIIDPNNPFLKMKKVKLLLDFDRRELALIELKKALEIEPEYLDAILMIEKEYEYYSDKKKYLEKILRIKKKSEKLNRERGSYLYDLHRNSFSSK